MDHSLDTLIIHVFSESEPKKKNTNNKVDHYETRAISIHFNQVYQHSYPSSYTLCKL